MRQICNVGGGILSALSNGSHNSVVLWVSLLALEVNGMDGMVHNILVR